MTEPATTDATVKRVRGRPFQKGQPRPAGAGRRRGAVNKATKDIKEFIQGITLGDATFCKNLAEFCKSPKLWDKPHMVAVLFAYGFGKAAPAQPTEASRPPLLFISLADPLTGATRTPWGQDPLKEKAQALLERKAARLALAEGKPAAEAYVPPSEAKPGDPEPELVVIDPDSLAGQVTARPK